jgi:hypothetical protein
MQSSPASRHFLPLSSKSSSQHLVLKHIQSCSSFSERDKVSHPYSLCCLCTVSVILHNKEPIVLLV